MHGLNSKLRIDRSSAVPLHVQVRDTLKELIANGDIQDTDKIITEKYLQEQFGVSRNTIRQAIASLSDAGVLQRERSKGIIINPESQQIIQETINGLSFTEAAVKKGMKPKSKLTEFKVIDNVKEINELFSVQEKGSFFEIARLRYLNNKPVCLIRSYIPQRITPELTQGDFTETGKAQSLFYIMEHFYNIPVLMWVENIEPILIPASAAKLLHTKSGRPGFLRKDIIYSNKQKIVAYQKTITNENYRLEGLVYKRER